MGSVPVFDTVSGAVAATGADTSVIFVPARAAAVASRASGQPRDVLYRLALQLKPVR